MHTLAIIPTFGRSSDMFFPPRTLNNLLAGLWMDNRYSEFLITNTL